MRRPSQFRNPGAVIRWLSLSSFICSGPEARKEKEWNQVLRAGCILQYNRRASPVTGGLGEGQGKHKAQPQCFHAQPVPQRFFGSFCIAAKGTRPAGRNISRPAHRRNIQVGGHMGPPLRFLKLPGVSARWGHRALHSCNDSKGASHRPTQQ